MKLNVSCGKQTWPDFYCIDAVQHPKATRPVDLLFEFRFGPDGALGETLPLDDGCAAELHCYHYIEHVYLWEAPALVAEFRRLLRPGGRLILELPNLEAACRNLLAGLSNQMSTWPLYGDPGHRDPFMCHRWGYTPKTIKELLVQSGFSSVWIGPPRTHGRRVKRDMRVEAIRA